MPGYLILDTETSGLPDWSRPADAEGQPRLASWCLIFVDGSLNIEHSWDGYVRPNGWEMPDEASAVHGITTKLLEDKGQSVLWPLSLLIAAYGRTLVAHNLQFDTKIMRGELRRIPSLRPWAEFFHSGICTMRGLTEACAILNPNGRPGFKFPRLSEACERILGKSHEGAHDAVADAHACLKLLRAMKERGLIRINKPYERPSAYRLPAPTNDELDGDSEEDDQGF